MQISDTMQAFHDLRASEEVDTAHLDALYQQLGPVSFDDLIGGRWKGGVFHNRHKAIDWLSKINWYGKEFVSRSDVKPLICRNKDDKDKLYSKPQNDGEASLWKIEFQGMVSAAMVYDKAAIVDHFRKVDWKTVMGVMTGKDPMVCDNGKLCYFYLERESGTVVQ
jgi:hypothetical protein